MHMLVPHILPEAQATLQQPLQVKPDWGIDARNVLKRVLPWNLVEHSLMASTNMGEAYNKRLQGVQRLARLHKQADGYGAFHAFPSLHLILSFSMCCPCQTAHNNISAERSAEHKTQHVQLNFFAGVWVQGLLHSAW